MRGPMRWDRKVVKIQLDPTTYCNASCGACIRNNNSREKKPELDLVHFDLNVWKRLVREDTRLMNIHGLTLNGNWGDAAMHPHLLEIVDEFIYYHKGASVRIHTNGGVRNESWWGDLAKILLNATEHKVLFAVDGLKDTHHLYRKGTDFNKVINNLRAFNEEKGNSEIITTVFDYNAHQIDDLEKLAEEIGCASFKARRSFHNNIAMYDENNNEYHVTAKSIPDSLYRHTVFENTLQHSNWQYPEIIHVRKHFEQEMDTECPWYNAQEIQLDPDGFVWPCCHISSYRSFIENGLPYSHTTVKEQYGEFNNLHNHSLQEILGHDWYSIDVAAGVKNGNWNICRKNCGAGCN